MKTKTWPQKQNGFMHDKKLKNKVHRQNYKNNVEEDSAVTDAYTLLLLHTRYRFS